MISELRLENFAGFKGAHRVPLRPITLIYGPNSSGKSALVRALALLKQSTGPASRHSESPLLFRGSLVDLGDFRNIVNSHDLRLRVGLGVTSTIRPRPNAEDQTELQAFDVAFRWNGELQNCLVDSILYSLPDSDNPDIEFRYRRMAAPESLGSLRVVPTKQLRGLTDSITESLARRRSRTLPDMHGENRHEADASRFPGPQDRAQVFRIIRDTPLALDSFLPSYRRPRAPEAPRGAEQLEYESLFEWGRMLHSRALDATAAIDNISYLGPLRTSPRRFEVAGDFQRAYVGPGGDGTAQILSVRPDLLVEVNRWLDELEIPYTLKIQRVSSRTYDSLGQLLALELTDIRTGTRVSPADVGFGISQVLPVVTQLLLRNSQVVLIEQPEIHLHPRLQARLASLFASVAHTGTQVVAETHSELLILRLQKLIATGILPATSVQVLYVGADENGSWLRSLSLSESGHFEDEWPDGFFEERYDEWIV